MRKVIDCEFLEKIKANFYENYQTAIFNLYAVEIGKIFIWFKTHCKNHTLEWSSGNGTNFFILDGEILDLNIKGNKRVNFLKPLSDFQKSINDETNAAPFVGDAPNLFYHPVDGIGKGRADFMGRKRTYRDYYLNY